MAEKLYDVVVIGGGPGGYTAALYAARANLSVVVLEKLTPGGQMGTTDVIDNYPGFPEGVNGFELAMQMKQGAERFGAQTQLAEVTQVELAGEPKVIHTKPTPWCWPAGPILGSWACRGNRSCGAGACPTAPPATGCSTGARPWPWWAAGTPPCPTCCTSPGCARKCT